MLSLLLCVLVIRIRSSCEYEQWTAAWDIGMSLSVCCQSVSLRESALYIYIYIYIHIYMYNIYTCICIGIYMYIIQPTRSGYIQLAKQDPYNILVHISVCAKYMLKLQDKTFIILAINQLNAQNLLL